jgi:hypothetical protein
MALRVWPEETLTPEHAQGRLRAAIFAAIEPSLTGPVRDALDLGCSVEVSTLALHDWLERRQAAHGEGPPQVRGLDLSPQMLAPCWRRRPGCCGPGASSPWWIRTPNPP